MCSQMMEICEIAIRRLNFAEYPRNRLTHPHSCTPQYLNGVKMIKGDCVIDVEPDNQFLFERKTNEMKR